MKKEGIGALTRLSAVDLFCGAGGLSYGLFREGINVTAGVDMDPACRYPFEHNIGGKFIEADISGLTPSVVSQLYPSGDIKILAGCAPCQPFSTYRQRNGGTNDERWGLLYKFAELIKGIRPQIVTIENVPRLTQHRVFQDFLRCLDICGYEFTYQVVNCRAYGVPQSRNRLVLLASLLGPISLVPGSEDSTSWVTVRKAIGELPRIRGGEEDSSDRLHTSQRLTDINLRRIRASRPGGTWRDWPAELRLPCHQKSTGHTYVSVYGRMEWDSLAPTITTQCYNYGAGRFGHPDQDRAISLREAAILQSFPKDYGFVADDKPMNFRTLSTLIGNAVPVELGAAIAMSIKNHLPS